MGSILESYDVIARVILQALVNSFWPGLMLMLIAWFAMRSIDRTSATTRHAIWVICLTAITALPFLPVKASRSFLTPVAPPPERLSSVLYRPSTVSAPNGSSSTTLSELPRPTTIKRDQSTSGSGGYSPTDSSQIYLPALPESQSQAAPATDGFVSRAIAGFLTGSVPGVMVAIWLVISSILAARIAWSYVFLFRIRRRLGLVAAAWRERGRQLAEVLGINRPVRIFTSPLVGAPMTIGWLRPLIILPIDLLRNLGEAEIDSILAHEMAHIKRWDYLTNLLQRLAQAVFFFHPAVWVIGRQLSLERELACDDWAIKMTGEPRRYARCLTRLVETMSGSRSFAAATGIIFGKHVISRRIEMILNRDRNATTSVSKAAMYSAIGSAGLAVVLSTLISPVIAIPLPQSSQLARTQKSLPQTPPVTATVPAPAQPSAPIAPVASGHTLPALAPQAPDPLDADQDLIPEVALLPVAAPDEPVFELLETMPAAQIAPVAFTPQLSSSMARTVAYRAALAPSDSVAQTPPAAPRVRPATATTIGETRNSEPAIPEAELISILTEVVKKDTDANVRAEALRGIYRFRSDASVNALLSLYDTIPDVKTKGEILSYIMRNEGDNSRAIAKLLQIAKSEKDETLRSRALSQLAKVKGDEGANHLIQIYDSLQDPKEKQTVIKYLGYNKTRKAADKLIQIARNDADPAVRQSAIRSLYAIDNRLYLDLRERGFGSNNKVSGLMELQDLDRLNVEMDWAAKQFNREEMERQMHETKKQLEELQFSIHPEPRAKPITAVPSTPPIK
ncbi:MAG: M56 family metallopeptidase [Acidobacteriota bacterium]